MPQASAGKSRNCFKQFWVDDAFRENSPTNTAQTNKSAAKKHPRFLPAMYPARMWAAITRDPHHDEFVKF